MISFGIEIEILNRHTERLGKKSSEYSIEIRQWCKYSDYVGNEFFFLFRSLSAFDEMRSHKELETKMNLKKSKEKRSEFRIVYDVYAAEFIPLANQLWITLSRWAQSYYSVYIFFCHLNIKRHSSYCSPPHNAPALHFTYKVKSVWNILKDLLLRFLFIFFFFSFFPICFQRTFEPFWSKTNFNS